MKEGFTLIELLIVVTMVGILASILLVFTGSSENVAKDSVSKSELEQLRLISAPLEASDSSVNFNTIAFCTGGLGVSALGTSIEERQGVGSFACNATNTAWVAVFKLLASPGKLWCNDSTGDSREIVPASTPASTKISLSSDGTLAIGVAVDDCGDV